MIKAEKLSISYKRLLFENVSFSLGNKEKVGLVGLNGCGKSTLLKILVGEELPDSGSIELSTGEVIGYLPQVFKDAFDGFELVGEFLESLVDNHLTDMWKVDKTLSKLDMVDVDHFQMISILSPGQKMKLYLAKLLLQNATILLLDEPTNHLDINGIQWFESFLKDFEGIVIVISHDRMFLNNVTTTIFEIDEEKLYVWDGNYDRYLEHKDYFKFARMKDFKAQELRRQKFEKMIEQISKRPDSKQKSAALQAARSRMKREVLDNEVDIYKERKIEAVSIEGSVHDSKRIFEMEGISFSYDSYKKETPNSNQKEILLKDISFDLFGAQKVWLVGPNGTGKSTLIKLLIGELEPSFGTIRWGANIRWEYFSQDQSHLPDDERVDDYFMRETNVSFSQSFGLLDQFLFDKTYRSQKLRNLSPGQRARLSFAVFAQRKYDFLILDEPTNHLDIKTKEIIETAIREFKGAVLLISHDRYFSENIGPNRIMTIKDKQLVTWMTD